MRQIIPFVLLCISILQLQGQEYKVGVDAPFEQLKVVGNIHLVLVPAETEALEYESDQDYESLTVVSENKVLRLKTKTELSNAPAIKVHLYYKTLKHIEVTKGGSIQSVDTLYSQVLSLNAETGGKAELRIKTDSLSARVNQGADIILYGETRAQSVNAYTWGNYLAYDLVVSDTYVKAATGAQVKVNATGLLDCNATSKATVGYWGEPTEKKIKSTVGGEVIHLTD